MDLGMARRMRDGGIPFAADSGLRVTGLRRGHIRCKTPFTGNGEHIDALHAGATFTLAEIPGGGLFLSSVDTQRFCPIVKALTTRSLKPAKATSAWNCRSTTSGSPS